jgi:hypothetical protein
MPEWLRNTMDSPFEGVQTPFCLGQVIAIDPERWVADVYLDQHHQTQRDIPIMSSYFHKEFGQGAYFMPEIGSICVVGQTYETYFIIGFLPVTDDQFIAANREQKPTQNLNEEFTQEARNQLRAPASEEGQGPRKMAYRCNREGNMLAGDYCLKTKAGNKIKVFTDGNILHEATKLCFRILSKLKNWILDICVNYLLKTPGGETRWTNDDITNESDLRREVKRLVTDEFTSFIELIGYDANTYRRMVVNRHQRELFGDILKPEHFFEQIREDGDWVRRVNHDEETDDDRYREHVAPDGEWTKTIEGPPSSSATYFKNVEADGDMDEQTDGNKDVYVDKDYHINTGGKLYLNC